ncbi:metallophosphoesterase [Chryseobacterium lactis]|uniref:Metallophosphoesterase n=1 Tax=Chryseobacterium lactis TaxID=1241981 RepID=A0A3G6RHT2_CHRLC|nr:metallophosphoesterase [Chryseobacterium lactis]AZA84125.1 metallophosphoesterase [Chryseobacterium lactis]AZB04511.1 metallophosphoesterase [Chryseobacterium lactis]PNW12680.1 metallophosphoesterase [Chryseobacterium lactis]
MQFNIKNTVPVSIKISLLGIILQSCATYDVQKSKSLAELPLQDSANIAHQFLLIGNLGGADRHSSQKTLQKLQNRLNNASAKSTLLFLGDNLYSQGMSGENNKESKQAQSIVENKLKITKNYKGNTVVIPGNHDWQYGLKGMKNQEKAVSQYLNTKKAFLPKNGCPIDKLKLENNITLITVDSQWFLENWENDSKINADCDIKSREDFFKEFEGLINKNQNNLIVVALHHPLISKGIHAGYFSWKDQLFPLGNQVPLPGIGTLINAFRSTSGISPQDMNNAHYIALTSRLKSIVQNNDNVIFVSGHDHNLQYLEEKNVRQIISGAGSENGAAKIAHSQGFSYGGNGYAVLNINQDGSANVAYYSTQNNSERLLTTIQVLKKVQHPTPTNNTSEKFSKTIMTSVYPESLTKKSRFYTWLWGEHYRKYYSIPIEAKVATLDTLKGGVTPVRAGGGHQSNSLQLVAKNGQEYAMRGVKKSAIRFFNAVAFKNSSLGADFEGTAAERFLLDFYTTGHPYTPFAIENMAEKINVLHTNSQLYYIPKQNKLGGFNSEYGNELYQIEGKLSGSKEDLKQLNGAKATMNTMDMMENLHKSEKYSVDQQSYIRARIFDMLLGDWDRHEGQWRWVEYKENDRYVYKPIPKDRDQAFSKYDGVVFKFIMMAPALRHMQTFKQDIRNVKWMNREPYPLDLAFLKNATEQDWKREAAYIQQNLSDKVIDEGFRNLPPEVQDETIRLIQKNLKIRRDKMVQYATEYYKALQKTVVLTGTNHQDQFVIKKEKNKINITQYRVKKEGNELVFQREYPKDMTKEIWVYGLDDNDTFDVSGTENSGIKVRIIGGENNDVYNIANGRNIKLYDFKSQKNTYQLAGHTTKKISDDYEINTYNYAKPTYDFFAGYPSISYNPDEGAKIGAHVGYTQNGFERNPYSARHTLQANYLTATGGAEFIYDGSFPNAIGKWAFNLNARFTTSNFAQNYFGFGNETVNNQDQFGKDYNRVKMQQIQFTPSLSRKSFLGFVQSIQLKYEDYKPKYTPERFITQSGQIDSRTFDSQKFLGAKYTFSYDHSDSPSFPTMGFGFSLSAAWKTNLEDTKRNFMTYEGLLNMAHRIDNKGHFVFATKVQGRYINNQHYEFFQGAELGGNNGLRSFRDYRFLGRSSLFQNSEVRWNFGRIKNGVAPVDFGILGGYDYGRVWMDGDDSRKWHQSVGGGIWMSALETLSIRATYFTGSEGGRFSAGAGFWF